MAALRARSAAAALAVGAAAAAVLWETGIPPRHGGLPAVPATLRVLGASVAIFGLAGFGLVRLLLPERLRPHEWLWVLPTGACAAGLALTVLGFAAVPFAASLALVLAAGLALAVVAVRRRGWPAATLPALGWPVYLAAIVFAFGVAPMLLRIHLDTVVGEGSDAHMAVGTAHLLQHHYPTSIVVSEPIDQVPPFWGSKYPIYYAFGAVADVAGLQTWQTLAPLAAVLLALAAVGVFLVARELLGAPAWAAAAAMGVAGIDRMVLHTGLHPYFNQTWGYFALPFSVALAWLVTRAEDRRGAIALFVIFLLTLTLAYPLAAPIPLLALLVTLRVERVALPNVRRLWHGRRSLVWMVPVALALLVPAAGAVAKARGAASVVLNPNHSLIQWGGDLSAFFPTQWFYSMPASRWGSLGVVVVLVLAVLGLRGRPRGVRWGLGSVFVFGVVAAAYFHGRKYGYYFHFKVLAFVAPLIVACAAVGAARLRRAGPPLLAGLVAATLVAALHEERATGRQLGSTQVELASWARALPHAASIRLDVAPPDQIWVGYFLSSRRLCSQHPLLDTDYPHVPISRRADFIVSRAGERRPRDAVGRPLRSNVDYVLWRESPRVPGPDLCSQRVLSRAIGNSLH